MRASLPMYDWPELRPATDALWQALAQALRSHGFAGVPDALVRDGDPAQTWADPDLLLSQTCGYPLTHEWAGRLRVVATPHYDTQGCNGPRYCSFIVVHRDADITDLEMLRGRTAAYNALDSQSGYSAFRATIAPLAKDGRFFETILASGSHLQSMAKVVSGSADVCSVDCVVWGLAQRCRRDLTENLRVLAETPSAPGLPFVTSVERSDEELTRLRAALSSVLSGPGGAGFRSDLLLCGLSLLDAADYAPILQIERDSLDLGYARLH